jgi:hypothetical protein
LGNFKGGSAAVFRRFLMPGMAITMACGLASCAPGGPTTGPTFTEKQSSVAPPAGGYGRIYIYRAAMGPGLLPMVKVNDEIVGEARTNGYLYLDRPPGNYKISASTKTQDDLYLPLEAGQIRFVQLVPQFGVLAWHIRAELVQDAKGSNDIVSLHYTGR